MTSWISARSDSSSGVTGSRERLGIRGVGLAVDRERELRRDDGLRRPLARPRRLGHVELELAAVALCLLVDVGDHAVADQHVADVRPLARVIDELLLTVQDRPALAAQVL